MDEVWLDILAESGPDEALGRLLTLWARTDPKPLVLLIDEIDGLADDVLLSVLRQIRTGYANRPKSFPQSIVLCGVQDVCSSRLHCRSADKIIVGGSVFDIKAATIRLREFLREDVVALLMQHTEENGQVFSPDAMEMIWCRTQGQPWLVNAMAKRLNEYGRVVTAEDVREVEEEMIQSRRMHLNHRLWDKLLDGQVRQVIRPLLMGEENPDFSTEDREYVRDLGLIAEGDPLRIANPMYTEMIPRELSSVARACLMVEPPRHMTEEGGLDSLNC